VKQETPHLIAQLRQVTAEAVLERRFNPALYPHAHIAVLAMNGAWYARLAGALAAADLLKAAGFELVDVTEFKQGSCRLCGHASSLSPSGGRRLNKRAQFVLSCTGLSLGRLRTVVDGDHGLRSLDDIAGRRPVGGSTEDAAGDLNLDPRPGALQEGTDASGSVWVTVDPSGDVLDVSVSRHWTDRIPEGRLGAAILEAHDLAHRKRRAASAMAASSEDTTSSHEDRYDPGMPDLHDPRWLGWVWQSLTEADLKLDMLQHQRDGERPEERMVIGPNGFVRVLAIGNAVTSVAVDAVRLAVSQPDLIATDACAAFALARPSRH
jgi:hypothetical protein